MIVCLLGLCADFRDCSLSCLRAGLKAGLLAGLLIYSFGWLLGFKMGPLDGDGEGSSPGRCNIRKQLLALENTRVPYLLGECLTCPRRQGQPARCLHSDW